MTTPKYIGGGFNSHEHNVKLFFIYVECIAEPGERKVEVDAISVASEAAKGWNILGFRPMWSVP